MFDPWSFACLMLPLFLQACCIQFAATSTFADLARKLLWLPIIIMSHRFTYNSFDPPSSNFPWNIAFFGVVPCYAVAKGFRFAFCDPPKHYTWTSHNPPQTTVGFALEALLSMRGVSWSYGAKAPTPPPLAKDTPTFVKRVVKRFLVHHIAVTVWAFPIIYSYKQHLRMDQLLLPAIGLQPNAVSARIASTVQAMLFGLVATSTIELGYCLAALTFCLFHGFFYHLGLAQKFDPTRWPPLFRNPASSESIRDFWSYKWHGLFLPDFLFLAFKPARSAANAFGLGKTISYFAGVAAVFLISGLFHEIALYCVSHDGVDPYLQTFGAFAVQPVGMLAEHLWTKSTGKRVGGWPGWAWSLSFVAFTFSFMIDAWMERGLVNGTPPYSNFKWYRFLLPFAPHLPEWIATVQN